MNCVLHLGAADVPRPIGGSFSALQGARTDQDVPEGTCIVSDVTHGLQGKHTPDEERTSARCTGVQVQGVSNSTGAPAATQLE